MVQLVYRVVIMLMDVTKVAALQLVYRQPVVVRVVTVIMDMAMDGIKSIMVCLS